MPDSTTATAAHFAPHVGSTFTTDGFSVELVAVNAFDADPNAPRQDPFELLFESDGEAYLGQGSYRFAHEELGEVEIFVVPIGPHRESGRMRYQAVFN